MTITQRAYNLLRLMSNARLFAYVLLWLMVILIVGTVAEKTLGLYAAQQRYFSSYIVWLGDMIPLPGLLTVAIFIFFSLVARLALEHWRWKNAGTIVIHIGAALLLFGGFVTAQISRDGVMIIPHGETRDYFEDLRHVELVVSDIRDDAIVHETVFSESQLASGDLSHSDLPFKMEPVTWCRNCALQRLPQAVTEGQPHGVAINFVLQTVPRDPDDERNRAGLAFRLHGTPDRDGLYAIFQDMPIREIVKVGSKSYWLTIRPVRIALPFALQLQRFTEELYPGTNKPKSYESAVIVKDQSIVWPSVIRMNEPLRYKGYTFYQSSFMESEGRHTTTILAVVQNAGRLFPYLSGIIIALGFVIHLIHRLTARKRSALG